MGYYIRTDVNHGKADWICQHYKNAQIVPAMIALNSFREGLGVICVVDNGPFEAAAFCYSEAEFDCFNSPTDRRPRLWVIMDINDAKLAAGYDK